MARNWAEKVGRNGWQWDLISLSTPLTLRTTAVFPTLQKKAILDLENMILTC